MEGGDFETFARKREIFTISDGFKVMDLKFAQQRLLLIFRTRLKLNKRAKIGTYWLKCITKIMKLT